MNPQHVQHLVCVSCRGELHLTVSSSISGRIEEGQLACTQCGAVYPIVRHVPRFVEGEDYTSAFGFEWNVHRRTQYDSWSGTTDSEDRFFGVTRWPRRLDGERILEVGSGSGRFTEQALSTGAFVAAMDYSNAVETVYSAHGEREEILVVQADLHRMPFRDAYFDRLFCFGVLQHTPAVPAAFLSLPRVIRPGGFIAVDVYDRRWWTVLKTKYWLRPITRRLGHEPLYRFCERYIDMLWPFARLLDRIPGGYHVSAQLLVPSKRHKYPTAADEWLKRWAKLDMFDMLAAEYDKPQTLRAVEEWLASAGFAQSEAHYGRNGIEARGRLGPTLATVKT